MGAVGEATIEAHNSGLGPLFFPAPLREAAVDEEEKEKQKGTEPPRPQRAREEKKRPDEKGAKKEGWGQADRICVRALGSVCLFFCGGALWAKEPRPPIQPANPYAPVLHISKKEKKPFPHAGCLGEDTVGTLPSDRYRWRRESAPPAQRGPWATTASAPSLGLGRSALFPRLCLFRIFVDGTVAIGRGRGSGRGPEAHKNQSLQLLRNNSAHPHIPTETRRKNPTTSNYGQRTVRLYAAAERRR